MPFARKWPGLHPNYEGVEHLTNKGDVFQWGGAWLCEDGICPTPDGRGNLIAVELPELRKPEGHFYVTSRRGKQFNSMIYSDKDPFNAADRFDVLLRVNDANEAWLLQGRCGSRSTISTVPSTAGRSSLDIAPGQPGALLAGGQRAVAQEGV